MLNKECCEGRVQLDILFRLALYTKRGWPGQARPRRDLADAAARFPLCAESERLFASRARFFGAFEFRFGAPDRRPVSVAHRGYRRNPMSAGVRGRDLPGPCLARPHLGNPGAPAIRT